MKLASYVNDGNESYGIVTDEGIIDLGSRLDNGPPTLQALIADGLDRARTIAETQAADFAADAVEYLPPIVRPGAIWCAGMNTHSHFREVGEIMGHNKLPKYPIMFLRNANTIVGHGQGMEKPDLEPAYDYEGEIAVVIGKRCRSVAAADAMDVIAGYGCFNEGSARRYQMRSRQGTAGKNAYRSGAFGPWLVTKDDVDVDDLVLQTRVNGEVRQNMAMDDLIFSFGELIEYLTEFTWLEPGDVIATGSPEGNGVMSKPVATLDVGDVVEVEVSGLGLLSNPVVEQQK